LIDAFRAWNFLVSLDILFCRHMIDAGSRVLDVSLERQDTANLFTVTHEQSQSEPSCYAVVS